MNILQYTLKSVNVWINKIKKKLYGNKFFFVYTEPAYFVNLKVESICLRISFDSDVTG